MSDGTTAVQVSPIPTESEMASIRQIFTNVANALVRASELAKQVEDLEQRFASLNEDHVRVMARSDQLEQSLSEARAQRDQAQQDHADLKTSYSNLSFDHEALKREAQAKADQIESLMHNVALARSQADSHLDAWGKATEELEAVKAQLAKIKGALGIVDPPKPEPSVEVALNLPDARPLTEPEVASQPTEPQHNPEPYTWDPNKF